MEMAKGALLLLSFLLTGIILVAALDEEDKKKCITSENGIDEYHLERTSI